MIITTSLISYVLYSQTQPQPFSIGIGGLLLEHQYTHEQVVSALGIPQSYKAINDGSLGYMREYLYKGNEIHFYENVFQHFSLKNSSYKLNGIVGVGDPVTKIYNLPHNKIEVYSLKRGTVYYFYFRNIEVDDMSPIRFYEENGIIIRIEYIYCDDV